MAPKKGAKKTKEQLAEEKRLAEEAAIAAQEAVREQERREQARKDAEAAAQQALINAQQAAEAERLQHEREEAADMMAQLEHRRRKEEHAMHAARQWERFLSCTTLPEATKVVAMNDYLNQACSLEPVESMQAALATCQEHMQLLQQCEALLMLAHHHQQQVQAVTQQQHVQQLWTAVQHTLDLQSAHILQESEDFLDEAGDVHLAAQVASCRWGLHINASRNARIRQVEWQELQLALELPRNLALAPVALQATWLDHDPHGAAASTDIMAVGALLKLELLALPPAPVHIKNWTLHQPLDQPGKLKLHRLPYPIPPAGADPATWVSEEEPPPIGVTVAMPTNVCLAEAEQPQVGLWDASSGTWVARGITDISVEAGMLSFQARTVGTLALLQKRSRLLPFKGWNVRPTGGRGGSSAAVTVLTGSPEVTLVFSVTGSGVQLVEPDLPGLKGLPATAVPVTTLLRQLSQRGVHVLPGSQDAEAAGVKPKVPEVATAMCDDLAMLAGAFLISSSRWNQELPADECICRLSEVVDWEDGGRTSAEHCKRIFAKEQEQGAQRVLPVVHRGIKGVSFSDGLDKREAFPQRPAYGSPDIETSPYAEVHSSIHRLLAGVKAAEGTPADDRLRASEESLQQALSTAPMFMQNLSLLLRCLNVFSFS